MRESPAVVKDLRTIRSSESPSCDILWEDRAELRPLRFPPGPGAQTARFAA